MRKKILALTAVMSLSLMCTACEKTASLTSESSVLNETPIVSTETSVSVPEESDPGEEPDPVIELFEGFMNGTVKAEVTEAGDRASYYRFTSAMTAGESYTLNEITTNLSSFMETDGWGKAPTLGAITSEYIDCGVDGKPDLHVTIELPVENIEPFVTDMIVVEKDGKLVIAFDGDSWSRSQISISENGTINDGGSSGASSVVYSTSFINGNGEYVFGYKGSEDYMPGSIDVFYVPIASEAVTVDISGLDLSSVCISAVCFEEKAVKDNIYISLTNIAEGAEGACFDADTPIGQAFAAAGLKVLTADDLTALMVTTLEERGLKY
ncbi:MAG: hypothetical protein J6X08_00005 [Lachnospiraceae bacterium]|nr:hypothetical protein [Lachnospiraceae bacterium]